MPRKTERWIIFGVYRRRRLSLLRQKERLQFFFLYHSAEWSITQNEVYELIIKTYKHLNSIGFILVKYVQWNINGERLY